MRAKQDDAIKNLEEAKKAIDDKIAEIEKRREDIATLEKASEKLAELAKQEKGVADCCLGLKVLDFVLLEVKSLRGHEVLLYEPAVHVVPAVA